ncbi:unnamed protein product [Rhodiola kirilowii]
MRQGPNESMYDYVEKFNRLERSCFNLWLPEKLIVEYLLDGLKPLDKMLLDASAGESMMNLSLSDIRKLIANVAENSRFREETSRQEEFTRTKNVAKVETPVNALADEMKTLKEMMIQVIRRKPVVVKPCEYCGATDHKTDECPTIIEQDPVEVNAIGGYQGYDNNWVGPSRPYGQGPAGQNWRNDTPRDVAHHQQAAPQTTQQFYRPPHRLYQQNGPGVYQKGLSHNQAGPSQPSPSKSLEDIVKELATTMQQNQAETKGVIAEMNKQLSQLATTVSELKKESGRLPSQTVQNPRGNVSVVILRSGKKLVVEPAGPEEEEGPMMSGENQTEPGALGTIRPEHSVLPDRSTRYQRLRKFRQARYQHPRKSGQA